MYRRVLFPLIGNLDPELVHDATIQLLATAGRVSPLLSAARRLHISDPRLQVQLWGLPFSTPLGVAAGLDKNGRAVAALLAMGWGHVEVGTVTPRPQPGNPRPRIFRLPADGALINRMGFPGNGVEAVRRQMEGRPRGHGVVGANIGANKQSVEAGTAAADYALGAERLYDVADYLAINVSSPNTARLRELQGKEALAELIGEVVSVRDRMTTRKAVLVKLAPDLSPGELDDIVDVCLAGGIDGLIATNTTLARPVTLHGSNVAESGGLSGRPLRDRATEVVRHLYQSTGGRLPIVGAGGIFAAEDAFERLAAGASLLQVYTGFIYEGPSLARRINRGLVRLMEQHGFRSIGEVTGSATK